MKFVSFVTLCEYMCVLCYSIFGLLVSVVVFGGSKILYLQISSKITFRSILLLLCCYVCFWPECQTYCSNHVNVSNLLPFQWSGAFTLVKTLAIMLAMKCLLHPQ